MKNINFYKNTFAICVITLFFSNHAWSNENLRCIGDCSGVGNKSIGANANPDDMVLVPGGSFLMGIDKKVNVDTKKMSKRQQLRYAVSKEAFRLDVPLEPFKIL